MPIQPTTTAVLKSSIVAAFTDARDKGTGSGSSDPDAIIEKLASDLTSAIESYVTSCIVTTIPGQTAIGTAAGIPVVAQTVSPGSTGA